MALCSIELNDVEVRAARGQQVIAASPGYALVRKRQIEIGRAAAGQAFLHPRETLNRFWQQLSETPLPGWGKRCRHHADLAYLHLQHVRELAGHPEAAVFAVPGHYGKTELALLLGLCEAAGVKAVGLVDAAVAAGAPHLAPGDYAFLELQQHQALITRLRVTDRIARRGVEIVPGAGRNRLETACVRAIVAAFLVQARFDPLAHAATEQLLYTHLSEWLALLAHRGELRVHVDFRGSRFEARVDRAALDRAAAPLFADIVRQLAPGEQLVTTERVAALPGFAAACRGALELPDDAVFCGLALHEKVFAGGRAASQLVTELPAAPDATVSRAARTTHDRATHLLVNHHAHALAAEPLYLAPRGRLARVRELDAVCRVCAGPDGARIEALDGAHVLVNGMPLAAPAALAAGDHVSFSGAGGSFVAITVLAPDAA
ncbi:MAG: hypothetical protein HY749_20995 [Gammaproteobacteria bacterium]|nr:hypothetical protein [Gammaproteobacteria bacterium]MBI5616966.1 hypothetical protein [Gammaproteobacteria bacterium]